MTSAQQTMTGFADEMGWDDEQQKLHLFDFVDHLSKNLGLWPGGLILEELQDFLSQQVRLETAAPADEPSDVDQNDPTDGSVFEPDADDNEPEPGHENDED